MNDLAQALSVAIATAREAGAMLRDEFHRPDGPRGVGDHADIDQPAEELIRSRLLAAFPWRYRGEETPFSDKGDPQYLWLVDPNDGTKDYLRGWRGSAVSIAGLRDGVPVLGVVYAFCYPDDEGDLFAWAEGCPLTWNGREVKVDLAQGTLQGVVFVSTAAQRLAAANQACVNPARFIALPSVAHRLARAAVGEGAAAVCLKSAHASRGAVGWDYAAGHALLRASGGILVDEKGAEVTYTSDGQSSVEDCFGGSPAAARELAKRYWKSLHQTVKMAVPAWKLTHLERGQAVRDVGRVRRAQGCLLGQLAGDALGGLVEFRAPQSIRVQYPSGVRDLVDGGTWHNLAGQPTDDSEMALILARTLAKYGTYDIHTALEGYLHWWPLAWDRGSTIRAALGSAVAGGDRAERLALARKNASQASQSNGSLMRISPLGIFGAGRPEQAAEWARLDSGLTHPNPVCCDSCAVFVAAIAHAIATGCSPTECHAAALDEAKRTSAHAAVVKTLEDARTEPPADYVSQMGWVLIALQNAFYQLLHAPNVEEGIVDTVMRGGDTDTNAAICGALLGAVHGRPAIPSRWLNAILSCRTLKETPTHHPQPQEFWPVDVLDLAEVLLAGPKFSPPESGGTPPH